MPPSSMKLSSRPEACNNGAGTRQKGNDITLHCRNENGGIRERAKNCLFPGIEYSARTHKKSQHIQQYKPGNFDIAQQIESLRARSRLRERAGESIY